jgi:hypothetical protein
MARHHLFHGLALLRRHIGHLLLGRRHDRHGFRAGRGDAVA